MGQLTADIRCWRRIRLTPCNTCSRGRYPDFSVIAFSNVPINSTIIIMIILFFECISFFEPMVAVGHNGTFDRYISNVRYCVQSVLFIDAFARESP